MPGHSLISDSTPIVHVGLHKTGTSWLQEQFYPKVTSHWFVPRHLARAALIEPHTYAYDAAAARAAIVGGQGDGHLPLLVSEEGLSGNMHTGGLAGAWTKELAQRIDAAFPASRIVVFLRRQETIIESAYRAYVKRGGTHSIARYLEPRTQALQALAPTFRFEHFDYHGLLRMYSGVFGRERISVFLHEELAADNKAFVRRFGAELGLDAHFEDLRFIRVNEGMSNAGVRAARLLNRFAEGETLYKTSLASLPRGLDVSRWVGRRVSQWLPKRQSLLDAASLARISARYATSNARAAQEFGLPLRAYGYSVNETA